MKIINLVLISVILSTAPSFSLATDRKDTQSSSNSQLCVAHVKDDWAAFYFPIIDYKEKLVWFQNNTRDNALEYSWEIEIETSKKTYKFGYYLFKFPGQKQREGSLPDLLRDAQISVLESVVRPDGGTTGTIRDDLKVRAGIVDGGVVIGIKDVTTFNAILKDKPKKAKFVVQDPEEENSFICNSKIEYLKQ